MSKPNVLDSPAEQHIQTLIAAWKATAGVSSSLTQRFSDPSHQAIVAIGEPAIPHILASLERDPDWWFAALKGITGADPVPAASRGKLTEMTRIWLAWAKDHGYRWRE